MKSLSVLAALLAVASLVSAHSEYEFFPIRNRHARRAGHKHLHKKHPDLPAVKRQSQCQFPTNVGLVPVTPSDQNAGWAMSPNQPCLPGNYCPYACPPGMGSSSYAVNYVRTSYGTMESRCYVIYVSIEYGMV